MSKKYIYGDLDVQGTLTEQGVEVGTYSKPSGGIPKSDLASSVQTSLSKADSALQSETYKGTVTAVKINGTTKNPTSGVVDIGTVITSHQDISGKADKTYVDSEISRVEGEIPSLDGYATQQWVNDQEFASDEDVTAIEEKIPSQATSSNQLADKSFVNSSIATNTSNYISNAGQPFTSLAQLQAYTGTVTNNDYAFVTGTDSAGNTYFDRYKATVSGSSVSWAKEYRLNNSSFTSDQWAAINSGITGSKVSEITSNTSARHTHSNKSVLDGITSTKVSTWDGVSSKYTKPSSGIPKTDLASGVQSSLDKADSAIQSSDLATVATTGNYNDLNNKPTILPDAPSDGEQYARKDGEWTKVGSGGDMSNYYTKSETNNLFTYKMSVQNKTLIIK